MENTNTIELIAADVRELQSNYDVLLEAHNGAVKCFNNNFKNLDGDIVNLHDQLAKLTAKQRKLSNFVVVAGIAGAYLAYKKFKEQDEKMTALLKEVEKLKGENQHGPNPYVEK